jgi:hypothetical protein
MKSIIGIGVALLIIAVSVVGVGYGLALWFLGWPPGPTAAAESWGVFGDFLGGTINPLLTFLTFIAVLITLLIQTQELKATRDELSLTRAEMSENRKIAEQHVNHLKSEADKSDIQRKIEADKSDIQKTMSIIDKSLNNLFLKDIAIAGTRVTMIEVMHILSKEVELAYESESIRIGNMSFDAKELMNKFKNDNISFLEYISSEFEHLNKFLTKYNDITENSSLVEYYVTKYMHACKIIALTGINKLQRYGIFYAKLIK